MKKLTLLFTMFFYTSFISFSQIPDTAWTRSFGGSRQDHAFAVDNTTDGGCVLAGFTNSNNKDVHGKHDTNMHIADIWVVRLDSKGDTIWTKAIGGSNDDYCHSVFETSDGDFFVAGFSESSDYDVPSNQGSSDWYLIKLDKQGKIIWSKSLGGSSGENPMDAIESADGNYFIVGYSNSNDGDIPFNRGSLDALVVKMNKNGIIKWIKTFGGSKTDKATSVFATQDGGVIIAGYTESSNGNIPNNKGKNDFWVIKLNNNGNIDWSKTFGGSQNDYAQSVLQLPDGNYIVAGSSGSNDGDFCNSSDNGLWVLKLTSTGDAIWIKSFSESGAASIIQTVDGGFAMISSSKSNDLDIPIGNQAYPNYRLLKIDSAGSLQWAKSYGGSHLDVCTDVVQLNNYGLLITGFAQSKDGYVWDNNGETDFWQVKLYSDIHKDADFKVFLRNSLNVNINGGMLEYRHGGGWQYASEIGKGIFAVDTDCETVDLRMTYDGHSSQRVNISTSENYIFQTSLVTFELRKRTGELGHNSGEVSFASGTVIGSTGDDGLGILQKELLPQEYTFRMKSRGGMNDITQDISVDPVVTWQMASMLVQLNKSDGTLGLNGAKVNYRGYRMQNFGSTGSHRDGRTKKDLLEGTYKLIVYYNGGKFIEEDFHVLHETENQLIIDPISTTVELIDSETGEAVNGGKVTNKGHSGHLMGFTGDNGSGIVTNDLLPLSYDFTMTYQGQSETIEDIDVTENSRITFYTGDLKSAEVATDKDFELVIYPNPFKGNTAIAFSMEQEEKVTIKIYNVQGELVEIIQDGMLSEGKHKITWNSRDNKKGIYFLKYSCSGNTMSKRIVKM